MLKVEQFSNAVYEQLIAAQRGPAPKRAEVEVAESTPSRKTGKYESGKKKKRKNVFAS
jgi:hypothetical protein